MERITVVVRVRPMNGKEQKAGEDIAVDYDESRNEIALDKSGRPWTFDRVFGRGTEQGDFYRDVARDVVQSALEGFNATIFAYGQTGSGKTWSMEGNREYPGEKSSCIMIKGGGCVCVCVCVCVFVCVFARARVLSCGSPD